MVTITAPGEAVLAPPPVVNVSTRAGNRKAARSIAFGTCAVAGPLALGAGVAALARSGRAGVIGGGVAALAIAAFRFQLDRLFAHEPAYAVERRVRGLEIRRYAPRIEAHTRLTVPDFESAIDEGFRRLAAYAKEHHLAMVTPVLTTPRARTHEVAFVMPPGYSLSQLPAPRDERITLVQIPARRVAVSRFRGRYTDAVMREQTRRLHELVIAADLETLGQPTFAGYDPPWTITLLRRTEMWIELA